MATLTQEQTDFLKSHHIPMDKTFDASGLSSKDYKAKMKQNGTLVAYGVPPCPKGHTLKNKQANCIQCNPHAIASIKRQATQGHIYIAISPSELLTKISTTSDNTDLATIQNQMNTEQHAGITDWQGVFFGKIDSVGEFENQIQQHFATVQIPKKLTPDSKTTKASQIYDVPIDKIESVLDTLPAFLNLTILQRDQAKIASFQTQYQTQLAERQATAERQAIEQQEREKAQLAEIQRQKQAELDQQKLALQQAKVAKLEQKRQRQQALLQEKQARQTKAKNNRQKAEGKNKVNLEQNTPPLATTDFNNQPSDFMSIFKNRNMLIVAGVIAGIVLLMVAMAIAQHTR